MINSIVKSVLKVQPAKIALVSVNEMEEMKAQKAFYEKIESEMGRKRAQTLDFWRRVSLVYAPVFALIFVAVYWLAGLKHANVI